MPCSPGPTVPTRAGGTDSRPAKASRCRLDVLEGSTREGRRGRLRGHSGSQLCRLGWPQVRCAPAVTCPDAWRSQPPAGPVSTGAVDITRVSAGVQAAGMSCEERALVSWPEERGPGCSLRPQSPETAVGAGRTASQGAVSARARTAEPPPERPCTSDRQRGSRSPALAQRLSRSGSLGGRASPRRPEAPPPPAPPRARAVSMETAAGTRAQRPPGPAAQTSGADGGGRARRAGGAWGKRGGWAPAPASLGQRRASPPRGPSPFCPQRPPPSPGVMTVLAENLPAAHTEGCPQVLGAPRPGLQATSVPLARLLPRLGPLLAPRRPSGCVCAVTGDAA